MELLGGLQQDFDLEEREQKRKGAQDIIVGAFVHETPPQNTVQIGGSVNFRIPTTEPLRSTSYNLIPG